MVLSLFFGFKGQASWPDIILSMYSGSKRVSAFRVPARKIIFSNVEEEKGLLCGVMNEAYLKVTLFKNNYTFN